MYQIQSSDLPAVLSDPSVFHRMVHEFREMQRRYAAHHAAEKPKVYLWGAQLRLIRDPGHPELYS